MVRPCMPAVNTYELGPVVMVSQFACDQWAVPHFIVPFMITVWTRNWFVGAFFAGFGEQVEYLALWAFQSFIIFLGTHEGTDFNRDIENLAGSHIDDTIWMGYLGVFFGWVFYQHFVFPALLRYKDIWNGRVLRVIFYAAFLFGVNIVLPAALHGVTVGSFPLGRLLYPIIHGVSFLLTVWWQPRSVWNGYTKAQAWQFWLGMWLISVIYNVQNIWDWFFSSHFQVTLVTGILLVGVFLPWSLYRWRWLQRIQLSFWFLWSGPLVLQTKEDLEKDRTRRMAERERQR